MDFITGTAADAKPDNLNIPATLREIGATIMPEVKHAKILLIGSLFYDDPRNANFTTQEFLPSTLSALVAWGHEVVDSPDPDLIRVEVPVTNTSALLVRLVELGTRVRVIGPEEVRDALRARLLAVGGVR